MRSFQTEAAEIEAVAIENSVDESLVPTQAAGFINLQASDPLTQPEQRVSGRWTGVWRAVNSAWDVADEHLANLFGLNESKYEWAVREYYWQKRQEKEHICEVLNSSPSQVQHTNSVHRGDAAAQSEALAGSALV